MTYFSLQYSTQQFEFTALIGAEILGPGEAELGRGDCFTMPPSASASLVVTDNDTILSGDANRNESSDDRSYQTADITVDGELVARGAKIYAEEYYVLRDQNGRTYKLIEIERADQGATDRADYYAFVGDVPPPGSQLKVVSIGEVCGSWIDYRELSAGLSWTPGTDCKLTVEAEDMELRGYQQECMANASGDEVIRLKGNEGSASMAFGGQTGTYTVELAYVDECDGEGEIQLWVGGKHVRTVELTQNGDGSGLWRSSISTISFEDIEIGQGEKIELRGFREGGEYVRIDSLSFCIQENGPTGPGGEPEPEPQPQPESCEVCINFDNFADGREASAGAKGTLVFEGVTFKAIRSQDRDGVYNDAMIFDSDARYASGGDADLLVRQGNLLIISEDGDTRDPDDNACGGTIVATFDDPSKLTQLMMVDIEEKGGTIKLYDADGALLKTVAVPVTGNGKVQWVDLGGTENVSVMVVKLAGSGAIGGVKFETCGGNAGPVAVDDAGVTDENTAVSLNLLANDSDPDGDTLTVTAVGGNAAGTSFAVTSAGGRTGTMTLGANGVLAFDPGVAFQDLGVGASDTVTVSYAIADGNGGTATANATITVHGLNDGPVAADDQGETDEDTAVSLDLLVNDSDPDGDALTVTSANGHAAGTSFAVTSAGGRTGTMTLGATGTLGFDPGAAFQDLGVGESDTVTVSYAITDGNGGVATANATITVHGLNDAPVAIEDLGETDEETGVSLDLLANDSDPDGDALTVTSVDGHAAGASFAVTSVGGRTGTMTLGANGVLAFDPGMAFQDLGVGASDTVTVSYAIADGNGGTATANATITVHGLNDGPVAADDQGETDEDTAVSLDLLANDSDPDGDALTVTSVNGHAAGASFAVTSAGGRTGTATLDADGTLTVDPSGAFEDLGAGDFDTVSVLYQIADGNGGSATARATVIVHGVNDAPVAVDDLYTVPETGLSVLDILANDSDPEGDPLTVTLLSQPIDGSVSVAPDGTVTFDPGTDFLGLSEGQTATVTFDYQISDGELTDTATVTVRVLGKGTFDPGTVTERQVVPVGDRPVTTTIETGGKTNDGTVDLRLSVALGDLVQSKYNILYVVDVSGSTGVEGSFGDTTVLDAQIAALQDLTAEFMSLGLPEGSATITVLPFNSRALPTAPIEGQAYPRVIFGDDEALSANDVDASLAALQAGGETNYVAAVFAAMGTIQTLEQQRGDAVNLVYFLSDGNPFPANSQPVSLLTQASAQLKAQASVHGVALGELIDPKYVDALDNTGGAQLITDDPTALGAALREAPMDPGVILGAALTLYDDAGVVIDTFQFTGADFVETPLGFELRVENVAGLDLFAGQSNTAELVIEFDKNGDSVADSSVSIDVEVEGVLPESFDF